MSKRRGFTLIELLVVIAIISLLVSVILPSLSSALNLARKVKCQSNLRQFSIATQMYAVDNNGIFPLLESSTNPPDASQWRYQYRQFVVFGPYVDGNEKLFQCPSAERTDTTGKDIDQATGLQIFSVTNNGKEQYTDYKMNDVYSADPNYVSVCGASIEKFRDSTWLVVMLDSDWASVSRHGDVDNLGFLDGHVDSFTMEEVDSSEDPYGNSPWYFWGTQ